MDILAFLKKNLKVLALISGLTVIGLGGYFGYQWYSEKQDLSPLSVAPDEIRGKVVILRKLKESYFIDYHNMFSQDVRRGLEWPEYIDLDYTIRVLKYEMAADKTGKRLAYCIFDAKEDRLIGDINIREMDSVGQFGCWINERYRGGGRIQEAVKLITNVYFRMNKEQSFIAHVRVWNKPSYKALLKAGFVDTKKNYQAVGEEPRYVLEFHRKK